MAQTKGTMIYETLYSKLKIDKQEIMIGTASFVISSQLREIYSICRCCWNVATYKWKTQNGKIEIISFSRKVSFLTDPNCQFRGVGQGIKQTYLYLWYPLFQAQWDRCDQQNHVTWHYLVKGHHLYSRNLKLKDRASFFSFFLKGHCMKSRRNKHSWYPYVIFGLR